MALTPEQPFLVFPSHVCEYGVEGALLLHRYQQLLDLLVTDKSQAVAIVISREQWLQLVPFWDEDQLALVTGQLVAQQAIDVGFLDDGQVQVGLPWYNEAATPANETTESYVQPETTTAAVESTTFYVEEPSAAESHSAVAPEMQPVLPPVLETMSELPVHDTPPPQQQNIRRVTRRRINPDNLMQQRGPAPTFGGSIGWQRDGEGGGSSDELHQRFEMHEERNQKLQAMYVGWQPSGTFFELLPRHGIPNEFAQECLDEFTLYWLDKDRKESNWDQKFLAWVKREWIRKQTREARQRNQQSETTGNIGHENTRRDSRTNRKRVTEAIMDIKDTDW